MLTKPQRIVLFFGGWATAVMAALLLFNALSADLFFALCLIGLLAITELSGPFVCRPRWRSRLDLALLAGIMLFVLLVAANVIAILDIRPF